MGTALAHTRSVVALSLPEMVILRQVFGLRLVAIFVPIVAVGILVLGFFLNAVPRSTCARAGFPPLVPAGLMAGPCPV